MKPKHIKAFMQIANNFAACSTAVRLQVGAIMVKDGRIISIGYNGMPSGWDNCCEKVVDVSPNDPRYDYNNFTKELKTKPEVLHAEANAIAKIARSSESSEGAVMFITHSPCMECSKLMYQAGIIKIYYGENYRDSAGLDFLKKCNIAVEQLI
jgi:dCMP deaminase